MGVQRRPNPDLKIQTSGRLRSDARPPLFFLCLKIRPNGCADSPTVNPALRPSETGASSERRKKAQKKPLRSLAEPHKLLIFAPRYSKNKPDLLTKQKPNKQWQ
jgi:hypothetical protein